MTDETSAPDAGIGSDIAPSYDIDNDPDGLTREDLIAKDWVLDDIFDFNFGPDESAKDAHFGLTLNFSGLLVSGLAITRAAWTAGTMAGFPENASHTRDALTKVWASDDEKAREAAASRKERNLPSRTRLSVHLKDVQIYAPGGPVNAAFWRGNVSDITGWTLGSYNPAE